MNRLQAILDTLRTGPASASYLSSILGDVPTASVRRDIQTLRKRGYNINDARDNNGLYRYIA